MGMFTWRNFSFVSFYLLSLFTIFIVSATSKQLMAIPDDLGFDIDICKVAYCGKGTCKRSQNQFDFFGFSCECDSGWKKLNVSSFEFPPCILPNCTVNVGCDNGPLPSKPASPPDLTNPCLVNLCGDGKCITTGGLEFKCECNEGSANLLNDPKMVCLKKCALGGDCNGLDLGFLPPGTPPATTNSSSGSPQTGTPPARTNSSSGSTQSGSGEMLNFPREFYMLTIMILAIIFQSWI